MTFMTRIKIWLVNKWCDHMNYIIISSWMAFMTTNQIMGVIIFVMFWCSEPSFEAMWVDYFHFVSLWTLRKYIFRDSPWVDKLLHISKLSKVLWKSILQALIIHMRKLQAIYVRGHMPSPWDFSFETMHLGNIPSFLWTSYERSVFETWVLGLKNCNGSSLEIISSKVTIVSYG